jgi:hypothetical protein
MLHVRKATDRGHADFGWLDTHHTFSFGRYYDPRYLGFRALRVMNEDRVQPGQGFPTHGHDNMEIVTYVLEGALAHRDSMGNGAVLKPGEFQRMSAGTGITHSEYNPSETEGAHFYQIWLTPEADGIEPSWEQKDFDSTGRQNAFQLVASPDGEEGALKIHQDARIYVANLEAGKSISYDLHEGRSAWLQVLRGSVAVNGTALETSDGVAVGEEARLDIRANKDAEVMLFDLA